MQMVLFRTRKVWTEGNLYVLGVCTVVVRPNEAGADEQNVSYQEVTSSRGWPDVKTLPTATSHYIGVGDWMGSGRVVDYVMSSCIIPVVGENSIVRQGLACDHRRIQDKCTSSTREPVFCPVINAAFVVYIRPNNICACGLGILS